MLTFLGERKNLLKKMKKDDVFTEPKKKTENNGEHLTDLPNPFIAFLPLLSVILTLNLLKWDIVVALLSGIILSMLTNVKLHKGFTKTISSGATGSITAIINTSAAVGSGSVVRAVPGFQTLTNLKGKSSYF